ncbi:unnamed protein product, partial [Mycena citricolor]
TPSEKRRNKPAGPLQCGFEIKKLPHGASASTRWASRMKFLVTQRVSDYSRKR